MATRTSELVRLTGAQALSGLSAGRRAAQAITTGFLPEFERRVLETEFLDRGPASERARAAVGRSVAQEIVTRRASAVEAAKERRGATDTRDAGGSQGGCPPGYEEIAPGDCFKVESVTSRGGSMANGMPGRFDQTLIFNPARTAAGTLIETQGCSRLPAQWMRDLCAAGVEFGEDLVTGSTGVESGELESANIDSGITCPDGFELQDGECVRAGVRGSIERTLPGGKSGTLADVEGAAAIDDFGIPVRFPTQVGTIQRRDGSSGPILRCPAGMILGLNDFCYVKGTLPRAMRKWKPEPRPLLSAQDGKILRRAKQLEKKLRRVSSKFVPRPRRSYGSRGVITKAEAARALRK